VPLLFAATLFVSASLLFMVQPMVGKMVLPLLGGSPAVWNACMVFFQLLLLLGYQYAHFVTGKYAPKKQWAIHLLVMMLPFAAFTLAVMFGIRHSPIAIAESLAPDDESSPVMSVLALLTVAIGIPFFVVSTSAPLLQKWFTATNHPSARDPYFLYSASNAGSLISLLGYPIFIEPYMTIVGQAWLFAAGFVVLAVMIFLCGRAAANPIGMPPSTEFDGPKIPVRSGPGGKANSPVAPVSATTEAPPLLARKLKWIALAFVPSSLMLGVTFHMTTDIASVPLLWVVPLALYLVTFIIAFGRVPDWFRVVIGNLAPVMLLLLVFVMISGVDPGFGVTLLLHILTFFAAALMCHYELARDRPSPQYLTEFFLLMSVGGVLGGIFNSLVAPLLFKHAYEYPIALMIACLLVPRLTDEEESEAKKGKTGDAALADSVMGWGMNPFVYIVRLFFREVDQQKGVARVLDFLLPIVVGVAFWGLRMMTSEPWFARMCTNIAQSLSISVHTIVIIFVYAVPVMLCFFFVDRPLRFALSVTAILGYSTYVDEENSSLVHSERSFFGILKISETEFTGGLVNPKTKEVFKNEDGSDMVARKYMLRKLMHGTTLHGTQFTYPDTPDGRLNSRHILDDFQMIFPGGTAMDPIAVTAAMHVYDIRQEPLTYYHRTGPVGAMFTELRTRKGGADATAPYAMVGLGTGSVSCYAQRGQPITFYEIDPAVKHLVADTDKYFSYVTDARNRGANLDIRMGDARLVLKKDTERKYALLLVDAFSSDSIPVHLLTVEAVQLYLERMTDDGMLALHISNRWIRLEPVVSAIAHKLGLTARVWNDDAENRLGKTASSWIVLARKPEHLGKLFTPLGDLAFGTSLSEKGNDRLRIEEAHSTEGTYYRSLMDLPITYCVVADYEDELKESIGKDRKRYTELDEAPDAKAAWLEWTQKKYAALCDPDGSQRLAVFQGMMAKGGTVSDFLGAFDNWFEEKLNNPDTTDKLRLKLQIDLIRKYEPGITLQEAMLREHGHGFRRLELLVDVHAWTDDYSDVLRVMGIPGLQTVRGFFGLPTPIKR
jgi:hypothetical protein